MQLLNRLRPALVAVLTLVLTGAATLPLAAQSIGTVRGKVVEAGSLRPLSGAQVSIPGTGRGALTNAAGDYLIAGVPTGAHTVRAQMIGFTTAEQGVNVAGGESVRTDFQLSAAAISLDEVVVTGTPGAAQKRTLGNAIATVKAAEVTEKTTITTVSDLLQANAPGVSIMGGAGTTGAGSNIRIRGASSLTAGNQPVFYVDGVKVSTARMGNFLTSCCNQDNGQNANLLDMINPDDIE
jgi:hypothetical protein